MTIKQFLKPEWKKIILTIGIYLLLTPIFLLTYTASIFLTFFLPITFPWGFISLILFSYLISCTIFWTNKKHPKIGKVLIGLIVIFVIIEIGFIVWFLSLFINISKKYPYPISNEWKTCETDEDCSFVKLECCEISFAVSLNKIAKEEIDKWKQDNCNFEYCPLMSVPSLPYSCDGAVVYSKAICSNSICSVGKFIGCDCLCSYVKPPDCEIIDEQVKKHFSEELIDVNLTLNEAKNYCNCSIEC